MAASGPNSPETDLTIRIIIPVHNRKSITRDCLSHLKNTQNWDQFEVIVVDDGSSDGTSQMVQNSFPTVELLQGDGSLWWGGSIRLGMEQAIERGTDVVVWMNDDVRPDDNTIVPLSKKAAEGKSLLSAHVKVDPGSKAEFEDKVSYQYTTLRRQSNTGIELVPYDESYRIQTGHMVSGRLTAVPSNIIDEIGLPNTNQFPHHHCDFDYTLRASEAGFEVGVYHGARACDVGFDLSPRLSPEVSLLEQIRNTFNGDRHSGYSVRERYQYTRRFVNGEWYIQLKEFSGLLLRDLGSLLYKFVLCLANDEQSFI